MNTEKIAIILLLVAAVVFLIIRCSIAYHTMPAFCGTINGIRTDVQKADDRSRYETMKQVEDTCRSMIASYRSDQLYYEQYKDSESSKEREWAMQVKARANKTAMSYNETADDIQRYINQLVDAGYAMSTIKKQYNLLSVFLKYANLEGGTVKLYAQNSLQAVIEKSRYAMEESPKTTSRRFMFMYFLLPH